MILSIFCTISIDTDHMWAVDCLNAFGFISSQCVQRSALINVYLLCWIVYISHFMFFFCSSVLLLYIIAYQTVCAQGKKTNEYLWLFEVYANWVWYVRIISKGSRIRKARHEDDVLSTTEILISKLTKFQRIFFSVSRSYVYEMHFLRCKRLCCASRNDNVFLSFDFNACCIFTKITI